MSATIQTAPVPGADPTTGEARTELNCSNTKLFDLLNTGELDAYYVGRHLRITRQSLDHYKQRKAYRKPGAKPVGFRGR